MLGLGKWFRDQVCDTCCQVADVQAFSVEPESSTFPFEDLYKASFLRIKTGGNVFEGIEKAKMLMLFYDGIHAHDTKKANMYIAHSLSLRKPVWLLPIRDIPAPRSLHQRPVVNDMWA